MKKVLSIVLVLALVLSLAACGKETFKFHDYTEYKLSEYVTLPDYNSYSFEAKEVTVSDDEVEEALEEKLDELVEAKKTAKEVYEGTVDKGDVISIAFAGVLEDGTTSDGMKSDGQAFTLGSGGWIDGFEEAIYGATIGKEIVANLKFPDPYTNAPELAGKPVTFTIRVLSKIAYDYPEATEEFIAANSGYASKAEFKAALREQLEKEAVTTARFELENDIFTKISEETTVSKLIQAEVDYETNSLKTEYEDAAKKANMSLEEFLKSNLDYTLEEFSNELQAYAEANVRDKMIIFALAQAEDVKVDEDAYEEIRQNLFALVNAKTDEEFKQLVGVSVDAYCQAYGVREGLVLDDVLAKIYDRIVK